MKKIVLIIVTLFTFRVSSQSIIAPPEMDPFEVVLAHRAAKSFIGDSTITIILIPYAPLNEYINGLAYQISPKMFIIHISYLLSSKIERKWTILHELGHIIDISNGTLHQYPPKWKGKKIKNNLPYDIRPWEISADIWAEKMWKALVDEPQPYIIFLTPSEE